MNLLAGLEEFVDNKKPSPLDQIYYFFLERGVLPSQLDELPIPYVMAMLNTHSYVVKEQEKAAKRNR
jgi:hypothetical protein